MSKTLIIYTHSNKNGHSGYSLKKVTYKLTEKNTTFNLINLYNITYDPNLSASKNYGSGHYELSNQNNEFQKNY